MNTKSLATMTGFISALAGGVTLRRIGQLIDSLHAHASRATVPLATVALVMGICAVPKATASVILVNGSFETTGALYSSALGGLNLPSGWVNNSGLNLQASSMLAGQEGTSAAGVTGQRMLRLASDNPDPLNTGFIVQNMGTMVAGESYTITGDALGGISTGTWGALAQLTSDGTLSPTTIYDTQSLDGFALGAVGVGALSLSYTAALADAGNSLFIWLRAKPSSLGVAARGGLDNLNLQLSVVPEPATLALLGLGLVGLGIGRRKKA